GFLASIEPFRHLPEAELEALAPTLTVRYVRRGEIVLDFEESNNFLRIIRSGAIDILGPDNVLLDRRDPGLTFGYSTLVGTNSSRYRMEAVEDSLAYDMPREVFIQLSKRNPDIARFYSSQSRRIRAGQKKLPMQVPTPMCCARIFTTSKFPRRCRARQTSASVKLPSAWMSTASPHCW